MLMIIQSQRTQKRNQKVCTRLLFNFWDLININQVDCLQHYRYVSNQHIIICVAEKFISLMFYLPARKVKRVQRKMLIITAISLSSNPDVLNWMFKVYRDIAGFKPLSVNGLTNIWVKMSSCKCMQTDTHFSINLETQHDANRIFKKNFKRLFMVRYSAQQEYNIYSALVL